MPTSCAAFNCTNRHQKGTNVTFHKFPLNNAPLLKKWLIALRRDHWVPTNASRLCSDHFIPSDFRFANDRKYLKDNIVPSKFDFPSHLRKPSPSRRRSPVKRKLNSCIDDVAEGTNDRTDTFDSVPSDHSYILPCPPKMAKTFDSVPSDHTYILPSPRKMAKTVEHLESKCHLLQRKLKLAKQKVKRQHSRIMSYEQTMRGLSKRLCTVGEPIIRDIYGDFISNLLQGKKKNLYADDVKKFSLTLQFYSSKAYNYIRNYIPLPNPSTIRKWASNVNGDPGFTEQAFAKIKEKAANKDNLYLCLMFDEMAIKQQIDFDGTQAVGYCDLGHGSLEDDDVPIATQALVFMVTAINDSWKIPIGYCLVNSLSSQLKVNLVLQYLRKLHDTGAKCISLTCDGLASNISMLKELGIKFDDNNAPITSFFPHPCNSSSVYCFLDAAHMLKLIRNLLAEKRALFHNEALIDWTYFEKLHKIQDKEGLHVANKISKQHIQWEQQKMKVKLAAQTLSQSVADAFRFLHKLGLEEFTDVESTAIFTGRMNDIFDVLNSCHPMGKHKKSPVRKQNEVSLQCFITDSIDYLKSLYDVNRTLLLKSRRYVGILGFILDLMSIRGISNELIWTETPKLDFLLTRKLSQDNLELFFATIRNRGGNSNNPTALQFKSAYKRCLLTQITPSTSGNCIPDETPVLNVAPDHVPNSVPEDIMSSFHVTFGAVNDHAYCSTASSEFTEYSENVVEYIAGWTVKTASKTLTCEECLSIINGSPGSCLMMKVKDRGGLLCASQEVLKLCKTAERVLRCNFSANLRPGKNLILKLQLQVFSLLSDTQNFKAYDHLFTCCEYGEESHYSTLLKLLLKIYFEARLHYIARNQSYNLHKKSVRQLFTKLILFKGQ